MFSPQSLPALWLPTLGKAAQQRRTAHPCSHYYGIMHLIFFRIPSSTIRTNPSQYYLKLPNVNTYATNRKEAGRESHAMVGDRSEPYIILPFSYPYPAYM
ncbi:hypothetical protein BDW75DRAFT_207522 [Aspergillus navahoensis]